MNIPEVLYEAVYAIAVTHPDKEIEELAVHERARLAAVFIEHHPWWHEAIIESPTFDELRMPLTVLLRGFADKKAPTVGGGTDPVEAAIFTLAGVLSAGAVEYGSNTTVIEAAWDAAQQRITDEANEKARTPPHDRD